MRSEMQLANSVYGPHEHRARPWRDAARRAAGRFDVPACVAPVSGLTALQTTLLFQLQGSGKKADGLKSVFFSRSKSIWTMRGARYHASRHHNGLDRIGYEDRMLF